MNTLTSDIENRKSQGQFLDIQMQCLNEKKKKDWEKKKATQTIAEEKISEPDDITIEITQNETQKNH